MKKIILIVLLIIMVVLGVRLLKKRRQAINETPSAKPMVHTIRTVTPETRTVSQTSKFLARLEAAHRAAISSRLANRISTITVRENQEVEAGEILVHIDDQEINTNIRSLQAQMAAAERQNQYNQAQYKRNQALFNVGGLSQEKLDASAVTVSTVTATIKELKQKIEGARIQLGYLNIKAPFSGIIGTIFLRQGDLATPGQPILTLNSLPQKLTFSFMPDSAEIEKGQEVYRQNHKIGIITTLYNDAKNGLTVAEAALDQQLEQPNNSYLSIEVVTREATGCAVPLQALLHREPGVRVMLYSRNRFTETPVRILARGQVFAVIEPTLKQPVAVAAEAKLSLLPTFAEVRITAGERHE
jgi:RND family efflux transporter MFP subunit